MDRTPRFLLLTRSLPWPTSIGTCQRTELIHRALSSCGDVDLLLVTRFDEITDQNRDLLTREFGLLGGVKPPDRLSVPWWRLHRSLSQRIGFGLEWTQPELHWSREVARVVRDVMNRCTYDLIFVRYLQPLAQTGRSWRVPTLLDADDFPSEVARGAERLDARDPEPAYIPVMRRIERRTCDRCEHVFVAKEADRISVGHERVSVLPNVPFVPRGKQPPEPCPPARDSRNVLMVGSFAHDVNVRAVDAFLKEVWPRVLASEPLARFQIVGHMPSADLAARWSRIAGVEVHGFVQELAEAYAGCAFTVVPIWEGGGTKIKVAESLLYGRTSVLASHSYRGYEDVLRHGESVHVAHEPGDLAAACIELLQRPDLRKAMAERGSAAVRAHRSVESFQALVVAAVQRALSERGVRPQ
jgi:polysaccharide biosynthesis protein PslH